MVSFYLARAGKAWIAELAELRGESWADTVRAMLTYSKHKMPPKWQPASTVATVKEQM